MRLSPSKILCYEDCPRQYYYRYVERLTREVRTAALVFGTSVHEACARYLVAMMRGEAFDPAGGFAEGWKRITAREQIEYGARMGPDDLAATGAALCGQFPHAWSASGLAPLVDARGEPLVERALEVRIADGIVLSGRIDVVAMNTEGDAGPVDIKTPVAPAEEGFEQISDQLTAYDILVDAHKARLGLERVGLGGFMEGIKRKVPARRVLGDAETRALLQACDADLADLVRVAMATGEPVGTLTALEVADATDLIGRLPPALKEVVARRIAGLDAKARIFTRDGGARWSGSAPTRRLKVACGKVRIAPPLSFTDFRSAAGGPQFRAPVLVGGRSEQQRAEYRRKVSWIAQDIAAGRFPRRARMAHNTPCTMCDFRALCHDGSMEGLRRRPHHRQQRRQAPST